MVAWTAGGAKGEEEDGWYELDFEAELNKPPATESLNWQSKNDEVEYNYDNVIVNTEVRREELVKVKIEKQGFARLPKPREANAKHVGFVKAATDGRHSEFWSQVNKAVAGSEELEGLSCRLKESYSLARAKSTLNAYVPLFRKWVEFAQRHNGHVLPANPGLVALFLQSGMEEAKREGYRESHVLQPLYAIDLAHRFTVEEVPEMAPCIGLLLDAAKRKLGRKKKRKKAATKKVVRSVVEKLIPDLDKVVLANLREVVFLMLLFVCEGRYDDVSRITPELVIDYGAFLWCSLRMGRPMGFGKVTSVGLKIRATPWGWRICLGSCWACCPRTQQVSLFSEE